MKCPNCGQEIIDSKDFCIKCGKRLKEEKRDIKPRTVIVIVLLLVLFGTGVCLSIMYLGTDKELKPFLEDTDNPNEEENTNDLDKLDESDIEKYFGNYVITKVVTNNTTSEDVIDEKENIPGWIVEFSDKRIKLGISSIEWIIIENPNFVVDNEDNVKSFFSSDSDLLNILASGEETFFKKKENVNFVISNNKLYVYRYNALFELKAITTNYKENSNFYNVTLLDTDYTEIINNKINEINEKIKNDIETSEKMIVYVNSKAEEEGNLIHIYVDEFIGPPYAGSSEILNVYTYNKITGQLLNLEDYLIYKNKTLGSIKSQYDTKGKEILNIYNNDPSIEPLSLTKDSVYYVENNILYIRYTNTPDGYQYVEIKL